MKKDVRLAAVVALTGLLLALAPAAFAAPQQQQTPPAPAENKEQKKRGGVLGAIFGQGAQDKTRPRTTDGARPPLDTRVDERLEPDDTTVTRSDVPVETLANRTEQMSEEEAAIIPYYNNFMRSYRLGPEDVISISVFGQDRYSKSGIIIPPDGSISYYLIPDGIHVTGKTTRQVAEEITRHLDEYIIDPKVTVTLDKAMSARFSVLGDVGQPGIRIMTRRLTAYEAVTEAGGVLSTGDKKKVFVLRRMQDNRLHPIPVNIAAIERGKAPDIVYLAPGDQVVVPGNNFKKLEKVLNLVSIVSFARIFTGGIF